MPALLHVVNGDATAARLGPLALPGDVLVWRDILVEGPVAAGMELDALAAWRAPWLARCLGIDRDAYVAAGRVQADALHRADRYDEIVLWFEQDLFCAVNLACLAGWIDRTQPAARITLVFPAEALGRTAPAALADLFAGRGPFDHVATAAWWGSYCGPDPRAFGPPPAALPFFDTARERHLARLPAVETGLGAVEAALLEALDGAPATFTDLFRLATGDARMRDLGMGDVQVAAHLAALAAGPTPLVTIEGDTRLTAPAFGTWRVAITDAGRGVRRGERDRLEAQPLDWWIGGVHIEGRDSAWRWDTVAREVRRR